VRPDKAAIDVLTVNAVCIKRANLFKIGRVFQARASVSSGIVITHCILSN
jgi:hypothetical protein